MRKSRLALVAAVVVACLGSAVVRCHAQTRSDDPFPVSIRVDASQSQGPLRRIWRFFGADEPNYAYMKDGRKLLHQLGELAPDEVFFRTHNLLNSGPGYPALKWGSTNIYAEDADGNPVYDWKIVDLIFDTYRERGVRPYVQLGFMPQALSVKPEPYAHSWRPGFPYGEVYTGWAYPPRDYDKWRELVFQWTRHCVERYGREEVESWWWETWNEPNIGYWQGKPEEFHKLHDYAMAGVLDALPTARIGGPDVAGDGGNFARDFYRHCLEGTNYASGEKGTRLDFVSFHAKGAPSWQGRHIRMGIANQLRTIDRGFGIVAEFPQLRDKPVVIGESDPEGCAACQGDQFSYRNGTMYSSYTAASFARKHDLADKHGINFAGALTWAFTFEDQPYFAGFRQLASNGLAMPVLNVFRMMSKMSGNRIAAESSAQVSLDEILDRGVRAQADVGVIASKSDTNLAIMVWHYHDDDLPGPDASVALKVTGLPDTIERASLQHFRVDKQHSDAYDAWLSMGSPVAPNRRQYAELEEASKLTPLHAAKSVDVDDAEVAIEFHLPRQGVSLLMLTWEQSNGDPHRDADDGAGESQSRVPRAFELIPLIDKSYPTISQASGRAVCGFSMGGAGSVRLSLEHPDLFTAAGSWGGALSFRGNGDQSPLLQTAKDHADKLKQNKFALLTVNGDQDRPNAFQPLEQVLSSLEIPHRLVVLEETNHNLGKYYERAGDTMIQFLAEQLQ